MGSPMRIQEFDDRMKRLLLEIRGGKCSFPPPQAGSAEYIRQYNLDVKCLIEMRDVGLRSLAETT